MLSCPNAGPVASVIPTAIPYQWMNASPIDGYSSLVLHQLKAATGIRSLTDYTQEEDAIVWELLGHATRIWHIATQQLQGTEEPVLRAEQRIFGYWSSRQAWLVRVSSHELHTHSGGVRCSA